MRMERGLGEGQYGCGFCYSSALVKPRSLWPTLDRNGQLWTDGWPTAGQYVKPSCDLQGMRRFVQPCSHFKFTPKEGNCWLWKGDLHLTKSLKITCWQSCAGPEGCCFSAWELQNSDLPTLDPNLWHENHVIATVKSSRQKGHCSLKPCSQFSVKLLILCKSGKNICSLSSTSPKQCWLFAWRH